MEKKVKKAIITAAGYGTRFLPATKNIPKEMLPIIDTPILHYIVEECVNSGIRDIIIVTRYGNNAVEDYFDSLYELEVFLKKRGKLEMYKKIRQLSSMASIAYVRQSKHLPYGNGSPLLAAKNFLGNDPFVLAWGDDLFLSKVPAVKQVVDAFEKSDCEAVLAVKEIPKKEISRYGVVNLKSGSKEEIESIIEKPSIEEVNSNYAEFGRIVLTPKIFEYLSSRKLGKNNELWLMDAIDKLCKNHKVIACPLDGEWYTTGDPLRFIQTTFEYALLRKDLRQDLLKYLRKRLKELE